MKIKNGDMVRVVVTEHGHGLKIGTIGKVVEHDTEGPCPSFTFRLETGNPEDRRWLLTEGEVKLCTPKEDFSRYEVICILDKLVRDLIEGNSKDVIIGERVRKEWLEKNVK